MCIRDRLQIKGPPDRDLMVARDVIDRQVRTMSRLLDDLLDVNRLDRHKLELRKEIVDLSVIIETALETASPAISMGRHRLTIAVPREPIVLEADPLRLS